jgi:hypothetical protein
MDRMLQTKTKTHKPGIYQYHPGLKLTKMLKKKTRQVVEEEDRKGDIRKADWFASPTLPSTYSKYPGRK